MANGGMQQAGTAAAALGGAFPGAGSGQAGAAAFAGGGRLQRAASAPLAKRHPGSPEEPPSDQVLARLQRTQQELQARRSCFGLPSWPACACDAGVRYEGWLLWWSSARRLCFNAPHVAEPCPSSHAPGQLQRQRAEQAEWAAAAQQLLRARGHAVPQAGPPQHAQQQQQRSGTLPPLHPQAGQQRRAASLDLQPGHDLGQAFSSLQASLGAIQQQQQGWEARRAAHQAERAQQQAQWETMRAAEQWGWEMQRQAEERAWRQAQRQQEEAWQDKRRQEEGQWLERRRGEEQAQQARQQRAQQHWQMECRAAQLPQPAAPEQRQVAAPEQRQLPPVRDFYTQPPPMGMPPSSLPPQYSPSEGGGGSSGSSSAAAAPPLPAVLEEPVRGCEGWLAGWLYTWRVHLGLGLACSDSPACCMPPHPAWLPAPRPARRIWAPHTRTCSRA